MNVPKQVIAVFGPGHGKTFLAVNLAASFANRKILTCVFDTNLVSQNTATYFNTIIKPGTGLIKAIEDINDDDNYWAQFIQHSRIKDLFLIAGSREDKVKDIVDVKQKYTRILEALKKTKEKFDITVVDCSFTLEPLNIQILKDCDRIIMPLLPDITSLNNAVTMTRILEEYMIPKNKIIYVLNKVTKRDQIQTRDIENISKGINIYSSIPLYKDENDICTNILTEIQAGKVKEIVSDLADKLIGIEFRPVKKKKKNIFFKFNLPHIKLPKIKLRDKEKRKEVRENINKKIQKANNLLIDEEEYIRDANG